MTTTRTFARSQTELAKIMDVTERTIRRWLRAGCPGRSPRGYPVAAIRDWRERHLGEATGGWRGRCARADPETARRLLRAKIAEKQAKTELLELKIRELRQQYMLRSEVAKRDPPRVACVREALERFVKRTVRDCASCSTPFDVERALAWWVREALLWLSRQ